MSSSWRSLPPEIRLLILECIIPGYGLEETTVGRGFPPASLLATVCKEWQDFFERRTFRRMDLRATDLQAFSKTILGENVIRLNYVTNVSLTIKLATFTRLTVDEPERATVVTQNNKIFTQAMEFPLKILSSWKGSLEIRGLCRNTEYFYRAGEQISELLANNCHDFTQICLPHDKFTCWHYFFVELVPIYRRKDSKLRDLALRTRHLGHTSRQETVTLYLCFIGEALRDLPALRTVELWNASSGFGCLFRCTIDDSRVTITWRCTDTRFTLEEKVIEQWAKLAPNHQLDVQRIPLTKSKKLSRGFKLSTIRPALHLRELIFDPIYEADMVKMKVQYPP